MKDHYPEACGVCETCLSGNRDECLFPCLFCGVCGDRNPTVIEVNLPEAEGNIRFYRAEFSTPQRMYKAFAGGRNTAKMNRIYGDGEIRELPMRTLCVPCAKRAFSIDDGQLRLLRRSWIMRRIFGITIQKYKKPVDRG